MSPLLAYHIVPFALSSANLSSADVRNLTSLGGARANTATSEGLGYVGSVEPDAASDGRLQQRGPAAAAQLPNDTLLAAGSLARSAAALGLPPANITRLPTLLANSTIAVAAAANGSLYVTGEGNNGTWARVVRPNVVAGEVGLPGCQQGQG
jgi:hypothetical protein